jgi:hypothetical protein
MDTANLQKSKNATEPAQYRVDNTDWLKTAAIILVSIDHIGYFFIENADWWSVFGRLAAPVFFFLLGYAQTRTVPLHWLWLGVILTLLDSWNNDLIWIAPNILLSFALIRLARPYVKTLIQSHGWFAFTLLTATLLAVLPFATNIVDYGAEGWLWALFGLCQRLSVDNRSGLTVGGASQSSVARAPTLIRNVDLMRLLSCLVAAVVYIWQEQREFSFSEIHFVTLTLGVIFLALCLYLFQRGPSHIQPSKSIAGVVRFIGRRTLEIYAIELAGFELTIMLLPDLAA